MARPSKLDHELIQKVYGIAKEGVPINYVCDSLMISQTCYSRWMRQGQEDEQKDIDSLEAEFYLTIKKAYGDYVIESNRRIREGKPGWQGSAWWLERTRQEFMPKQEIKAGDDGKVTVVLGGKIKDIKNDNNK